ncbi:hypothetical protein EDC05_003047 [Coemansia umbellata]|uniref:DUF887-domain-containing protein n=1 Tax=Coemansia umbellata TaxID=1424467 RepID=A0ABQ8PMX3_9FUNG|nr:hypothetical protein EDC05_003047 [Coemansia umbellata]
MLFPNAYGKLDDEGKRGWTVSVLTLVHSVFDSSFAIAYLNHPTLNNDKMEGYDRDFEIYLAIAGGYYLWDFLINFLAFVITFIGIRFGFEAYHTLLLASNVYRGKTGNTFFPFAVFVTVMGLALTTLNAIWLRQILTATYYTLFKSAEKDSVKGKKAKSE